MKYESTILKRLIDTYGVVGNPRYISEIIKEFIVRGKECFPNLFTYQADWLAHIDEFGLNPTYTVSYTGQSIYAPNTLERPVKSAILKGSTKYRDIDTGEFLETFEEGRNLELVSVKMPVLTTKNKLNSDDIVLTSSLNGGASILIQNGTNLYLRVPNRWGRVIFNFDYEIGKTYNLSFECEFDSTDSVNWCVDFNKDGGSRTFLSSNSPIFSKDFTPTGESPIQICNVAGNNGCTFKNFFISEVETKDEPYKSNILTTPSDLTLRGIGDVKDTLDCLTGEVVERVGEIVLDGSESWTKYQNTFYTRLDTLPRDSDYTSIIMCSDLPVVPAISHLVNANKGVTGYTKNSSYVGENWVYVKFEDVNDVDALKMKLSENPITVQYHLANESIKTVDLTILDQNGQNVKQLMSFSGGTHINTGSLEGSPLPSVSVSVETDLEETLMVCSLDGNTM